MMYTFTRPNACSARLLHAEIDAILSVPYMIEWTNIHITVALDNELSDEQLGALSAVVDSHDGAAAIESDKLEAEKIAAIQLANKVLVESARAKRLAGIQLTTQELAALVDAMLFPA